jgi:hypothetical protein
VGGGGWRRRGLHLHLHSTTIHQNSDDYTSALHKRTLKKKINYKFCSYGSWIYNYPCNQCLSPLMLWVRISIRARSTTLCDKVCQWLATGRWFSPGPPLSFATKTDRYDITEILLKVALNTIKQKKTKQQQQTNKRKTK